MTQHAALLDLPEPIALEFNEGRVLDVTTVNELVTAYKSHPGKVAAWLRDGEPEITRSAVKLLRAFLGAKFGEEEAVTPGSGDATAVPSASSPPASAQATFAMQAGANRWRCTGLLVRHGQGEGVLVLGRRPGGEGLAWLRRADGVEVEVALAGLVPLRLLGAGD